METKVTLRRFLEIAPDIISPWICKVYVEAYMAEYKEIVSQPIKFYPGNEFHEYALRDIKNLEPYLDYEIYNFEQEYSYGEVDMQVIRIRKMEA